MKVLHLVTRDQRRGAEVDALEIAGQLDAAGLAGTVRALAPTPPGQIGLGLVTLGPSPSHPRTLAALRREAQQHDVVVAHGSSTLPASRLALMGSSTPFVYRTIGTPSMWADSILRRERVRWMLNGARAVAALGEGSRRDVLTTYRLPAERVVVVGCGHPTDHFRPPTPEERRDARETLGLPCQAPVVVVVASLTAEKRVQDAIAAAMAVPDVHLLVVGDGPERRRLEAAVPASDTARTLFTGHVEDVRTALRAADVALSTSATEGIPGALVQAGLTGLPAVATHVGFVDEVVLDGRTGRLVEAGDVKGATGAIEESLARREEWGVAARRHCEKAFDPTRSGARWQALLTSKLVTG